MDLLPEKHETLVLQPGHVKPLPKNATKKQKRRAGGFLEKMASMRAAKMRKADEYRQKVGYEGDTPTNGDDDSVSAASALTTSGLDACLSWMVEEGATGLEKVNFKESKDGQICCEANNSIKVGDVIFEIPLKCVASPSSVETCELGSLCQQKDADVSNTLKLLICMIKNYTIDGDMHVFMKSLDVAGGPSSNGSVKVEPSDNSKSSEIEAGVDEHMAKMGQLIDLYASLPGKGKADSSMLSEVFTRPTMTWAFSHLMSKAVPVKQGIFTASSSSSSSSKAAAKKGASVKEDDEEEGKDVPALVPALVFLRNSDPPPSSSSWLKLEFTADSVKVICNSARKRGEELYGDGGLGSLDW